MKTLNILAKADADRESTTLQFECIGRGVLSKEEEATEHKLDAQELYKVLISQCDLGMISELAHLLISLPNPNSLPTIR